MNPNVAGSLISGGAGFLGGLTQGLLNYYGAKETNKTSERIARMNNDTMLQAMREQTKADQDYNSVGAQMQRSMMAGINPMLMAGAQPTSVSAAAVPNLDQPSLMNPFGNFPNLGTTFASSFMQAKQLDNVEKQLDIQDFESTIELLRVVGDLSKAGNLTSDDITNLVNSFVREDKRSSVSPLAQDQFIKTRLVNAVESSNLDIAEKRYMFGWLDEMQNARFVNLLADTEQKQTMSIVNRSVANLNDQKRKEVEQAIKNMEEQWKSLNASASIDVHKAQNFAKYFDAEVKKLQSEAKISEQEARFYLWTKINETISSLPFSGGVTKTFK